MSLYNLIFGVNALSEKLLSALNVDARKTGRFRDCYLRRLDRALVVEVLTRNGGGNREEYVEAFRYMSRHPLYMGESEGSSDSTYCSFFFRLPEPHREELKRLAEEEPGVVVTLDATERMRQFTARIETSPNDPEVKRVIEATRPIMEEAQRLVSDGHQAIGIIDTEPLSGAVSPMIVIHGRGSN